MKNWNVPAFVLPRVILILIGSMGVACVNGQQRARPKPQFEKKTITTDFISEGAATGDVNHDGKEDILAGGYWFEAPNWQRHRIYDEKHYTTTDFCNSFLNFSMDVNQDGWVDLVRVALPGEEAVWYENPGKPDVD